MHFALLENNWTDEAASIWGDMLELSRPATYAEAKADFDKNGVGFAFADYFDDDLGYMGPCPMGVSVENRDEYDGDMPGCIWRGADTPFAENH